MKKMLLIFSVAFIGSVSSCENKQETENKGVKEVIHTEEIEEGLRLDDGKKWIVNAETHQGMTQIRVILENMDPLSLEDYSLMGDKCDEQTGMIIHNCSMVGEAHNQLHNVLHPILDDIDNLRKATTLEECEASVTSLEKNISDYFNHFELK